MKPSNKELKYDEWDESCKYSKEKQNIIKILRRYDEQHVKLQSWNFIPINTIKNFITLKNNSFRVVGPLFDRDVKKDGIIW